MKPILTAIAFLILCFTSAMAQEISCRVTFTNIESLPSEARDNLSDFISQIEQYINGYRWTSVDFGDERIHCTINISLLGAKENHYVAQAFVGSQRPIRDAGQNTAIVRLMDDKWEFDYIRNQSLVHTDYRFDPLLSFIDFYVYIILGYDFDTYKSDDGSPYFQKAFEIINRARGSADAGKGWDIAPQSTYSRAQLIDELLNPKFNDIRDAVFRYHARGLDLLHRDSRKATKNILAALEKIGKLRDKVNQRILIEKLFFETKYLEIAETFLTYPDRSVYKRLSRIDQVHQQTYEKYAEKHGERGNETGLK